MSLRWGNSNCGDVPSITWLLVLIAGVRVASLGPLLDWAAAVVPPRRRAATPVLLFGTAGMRKLALPQQAALLVQVRAALNASPFRCALNL